MSEWPTTRPLRRPLRYDSLRNCTGPLTLRFRRSVALRRDEKHDRQWILRQSRRIEESDWRHVVRSGHSCWHGRMRDLPVGRLHGRRERQFARRVGNIACIPIALSDLHSGSALSTNCRLHDAFRPLLFHLCESGSADFHGHRSPFPATFNKLSADHRYLSAHVAVCCFGRLRNSDVDVALANSSALAQIVSLRRQV